MSAYSSPLMHNGTINNTFNNNDYNYASSSINQTTADSRYLKLTGGTVLNTLTANNLTVSNNLNLTNNLSLPSTYNAPTSSQLGYFVSSSVGTGNSATGVINQTSITLPSPGVYIITANINLGQVANFYYQASISDVSATINNNCFSDSINALTYTAGFNINLTLNYVNTSANKTIYLVSGNNNGGFFSVNNVYLSALRIA